MKYIKKYEKINPKFKVGQHVLLDENGSYFLLGTTPLQRTNFYKFISNTVGKIYTINNVHDNIAIEYDNVPLEIGLLNQFTTYMAVSAYHPAVTVLMVKEKNIKFVGDTLSDIEKQKSADDLNL